MPIDIAATAQLLWCGIVGGFGVREKSGIEIVDLHFSVEGPGRDFIAVLGKDEFARNYVRLGRDFAHGDAVAGSLFILLAVGQGFAGAEIDEVIVGSIGRSFAVRYIRISVCCRRLLDDIRAKDVVATIATAVAFSAIDTVQLLSFTAAHLALASDGVLQISVAATSTSTRDAADSTAATTR